jgi:ubiquitin-protein ligase
MSSKRVLKELSLVQADPIPGVSVVLGDEANTSRWHVSIQGPAGSPYERGVFAVLVALPAEYPFKPPHVRFCTRVYHPNVANDAAGGVCLGLLKTEAWKPSTHLRSVLEALVSLLADPQPDDPVEADIAREFKDEHALWAQKAAKMTSMYAVGVEPVWSDVEAPPA